VGSGVLDCKIHAEARRILPAGSIKDFEEAYRTNGGLPTDHGHHCLPFCAVCGAATGYAALVAQRGPEPNGILEAEIGRSKRILAYWVDYYAETECGAPTPQAAPKKGP
jgi:hypothetical protein